MEQPCEVCCATGDIESSARAKFDIDFGGRGRTFEEDFRRIREGLWGGGEYIRWLLEEYSIVGDKHTEYVGQVKHVLERDPATKVIFTLRDGRASIASSVRNWRTLKSRPHWVKPSIREAEEYWLSCVHALVEAMQNTEAFVVRYEDACREPSQLVADLSSFLDFPLAIDEPETQYRPVNVDSWKEECAGHAWCQDTQSILKQFNYQP